MRKLLWFTVGFAATSAVGVYLASGIWLLLLGGFCLAALIALLCLKSQYSRQAACVLLGCVIGLGWLWCFDWLTLAPARQMDGKTLSVTIEVTDYSEETSAGIVAEGRMELAGKPYSVQFYLNEDVTLQPGDRVEGGVRLRYTGGGSENPTYHRGKGIFLLAYPKGEHKIVSQEKIPFAYFPAQLRWNILSLLENVFPEDTAAFAQALLLGETKGLSFETVWALKNSGVYHVVAVSGMHVSILFALVYLLCGKRRGLTALIGFPALFLFAAVAGFTPSIVRACIMQAIMILALLVNKEYDPPTALAAAVLIILAQNPLSITSVSLQLSVGCIAGIFLFTQKIHDYFLNKTRLGPAKGKSVKARLTRWVVGSVSVTLGAVSLTTPLCALYFESVSISGILTNLLILWLVTLIFYGVMIACLLGVLWLPLGKGIGSLISLPIRLVLWVAKMISNIPLSSVYTCSIYIVAWLVFCYVLLMVYFKIKKKRPFILACCMSVGLIGAVACSWIEPKMDDFRITAVDVGQGQCIILQADDRYYMVDCGGDSGDQAANRAIGLLLSQGVFRLDGLIITHYDADHAAGAPQLLSVIPTDKLYLPNMDEEHEIRKNLTQWHSEKIHWVEDTVVLEDEGIRIIPSFKTQDSNESSLCILFQQENCDILITGDRSEEGERYLMESTDLPDLEILVAGHHGSKASTSWELLDSTRPEIVIISVGEDNSYGHPSWETLERLQIFGCDVYRTDTMGTIIFRG